MSSNSYASKPPAPTMEIYSGSVFAGKEAVDGTYVSVFNADWQGAPISKTPGLVENGRWSVVVDYPPTDGDHVYAEARAVVDGEPGPWSASSPKYTVGNSPFLPTPVMPNITLYSTAYFSGNEGTPDTSIVVKNASKDDAPVAKDSVDVSNGIWQLYADTPAAVGDEIYAVATQLAGPDSYGGTTSKSQSYTVTDPAVPVPPTIQSSRTSTIFGTSLPKTSVTMTVQEPNGWTRTSPPIAVSDRKWSVDIGAQLPLGTTISATASYSSGAPSDPYIVQVGARSSPPVWVEAVGTNSVSGRGSVDGQKILGWRLSDGKKIVDYPLSPRQDHFLAYYQDGQTLSKGDLLYLVSTSPNPVNMSPYNIKPEGYLGP